MRHQAKPFTIELKRGRRIGGPSSAFDADPRAFSKENTHAKSPEFVGERWWLTYNANPGNGEPKRPDFPVSAPQSEMPCAIAPRPPVGRILPDLTPQDWLIQTAPEQASAGHAKRPMVGGTPADGTRPKAGRDKRRQGSARESAPQALATLKQAPEQRKKQKPGTTSDCASIGGQAGVVQRIPKPPNGVHTRRAMRKSKSIRELRAGERWKRRLPSVCW